MLSYRCKQNEGVIANMEAALSKFAKQGLRTLVFGKRTLRVDEYSSLKQQFDMLEKQRADILMTKDASKRRFHELS
jgi:magnesium-transporting ATPase (P-type)